MAINLTMLRTLKKIHNLCNLSQFTQKQTNNLNSPIRDIEYIVKAFPQNKTQIPYSNHSWILKQEVKKEGMKGKERIGKEKRKKGR